MSRMTIKSVMTGGGGGGGRVVDSGQFEMEWVVT